MIEKSDKNLFLFLFPYILYLFSHMFCKVIIFSSIMRYINIIIYVLFIIIFIIKKGKYKINSLLIILLSTLIMSISASICKDNMLLIPLLFIIAFKDVDFNNFIKIDVIIRIIFFALVVTLYFFGMTENYITYRSDGTMRSSMGFSHPNIFGTYVLTICMDVFYINLRKKNIIPIIIFISSIIAINYFCDSRTSLICVLILLIVYILSLRFSFNFIYNKRNKFILKNLFIIFFILSYIFVIIYRLKVPISFKLNEIFSGRLSYMNNFLDRYGVNLFGTKIDFISTQLASMKNLNTWVLDNSYFLILIEYGILPFILVYLCIYNVMDFALKNKNTKLLIIFVLYLIFGLMETGTFNITFNIYLLYISKIIFYKGGQYDKKNY